MPAQAAPMTPLMALALAGLFLMIGQEPAAVMTIVAFHCMLRTGELFLPCRRQVVFAADGLSAVIILNDTRSTNRQGGSELITVDDPMVVRALRRRCLGLLPGDMLMDLTQPAFRQLFTRAVRFFDLVELRILPYSLRRGGATWDFRVYGKMSRTLDRGRWQQERTARLYVQDALALLGDMQLSERTSRDLLTAARSFGRWAS